MDVINLEVGGGISCVLDQREINVTLHAAA